MATDPSVFLQGLIGTTGIGGAILQSALAQQQKRQDLRLGEQQIQQNAIQLDALRAKAEQETAYQGEAERYAANPTPNGLLGLIARYPDKYEALKSGWSAKDDAVRTADLRFFSETESAISNGNTEIAAKAIRSRLDAEKAAGIPTDQEERWLEGLESPDKATREAAAKGYRAFALGQIAAATGPDRFASAYGAVTKSDEGFTLGPGSKRFDAQGKLVAEAPFAPRPVTVGEGDTVVEYQPGNGGGSGAYTGGWTPRERNGGDNSDAAVDGKIAGAAKYLKVDPDADISGLSPMAIARAMTLSEGGAGSLADRNNNPGNLRNSDGSFKKFATKEAGLAAAAALVQRKLKAGQTTVRSMIEGLPQQGGSGTRVIAQGAPKAGYRPATPDEKRAYGIDPSTPAQIAPNGQINVIPGTSKGGAAVDPKGEGALRREFNSQPQVKDFQTVRASYQQVQALASKSAPTAADDIALIFSYMKMLDPTSVVREGEFAVAQNATGVPEQVLNLYNRAVSGNRLNASQRKNMIAAAASVYGTRRDAYNSTAERYRGIAEDYGYDQGRIAPIAFRNARTVEEGERLPSGTPYLLPNGKAFRSGEGDINYKRNAAGARTQGKPQFKIVSRRPAR